MTTKVQYTDQADRQLKIDANANKILIEEQNLFDGNFLIFTDIKPLENQIADMQDNQLTIMEAIADLYSALPTA